MNHTPSPDGPASAPAATSEPKVASATVTFYLVDSDKIYVGFTPEKLDPVRHKGHHNALAILRLVNTVMCRATPEETREVAEIVNRIAARADLTDAMQEGGDHA